MANKQLVNYIREQLAHKTDINQIRTILATQGWMQQDIEAAIQEVYETSNNHNIKKHHTNFIAIITLVIIILMITTALFLVVFKNNEETINKPVINERKNTIINEPSTPENTKSNNEETKTINENKLSGWAVCAADSDSEEKNNCYKKLNKENKNFNCDEIKDKEERTFCYRAKEIILIQEYEAGK